MNKILLSTILCGALLFSVPYSAYSAVEIVDNDFQNVSISVSGGLLHVVGANGLVLYIYNVAGVCVNSFKIEGNDKHYDMSSHRGCYIIKIGKTVRKVSIS